MRPPGFAAALLAALLWALASSVVLAQSGDSQQPSLPEPIPPPLPPEPRPEDVPDYQSIIKDVDGAEWTLPAELLEQLAQKSRVYQAVLKSFTCDETVRRADYDRGIVGRERVNTYGYLLVTDAESDSIRESRREFDKKGELRSAEVSDEEPFPPAYEWVFLFSTFNQPMFAYRYVSKHFEGFDVVHEIEFKGALPFTDGRDIRQWEGKVLVDAFTHTPLQVLAEPNGQQQRIRQMFEQYNRSFNIMGMRTGKKPDGHRAQVRFGFRKRFEGAHPLSLTFPTSLRYDTQRAVSPRQVEPIRASTRTYSRYRFFTAEATPEMLDGPPKSGG